MSHLGYEIIAVLAAICSGVFVYSNRPYDNWDAVVINLVLWYGIFFLGIVIPVWIVIWFVG